MARTLFLTLVAVLTAQQATAASLCTAKETVVFSCATANSKVISLCASSVLTADSGYLQYRFGQTGKLELVYPATLEHPKKHFQYGTQTYSGGGSALVNFNNGDYAYTVFSGIGKGWGEEGVVVMKSGKRIAYLKCTGDSDGGLDPQLLEKAGVPEDPNAVEFEIPISTKRPKRHG